MHKATEVTKFKEDFNTFFIKAFLIKHFTCNCTEN